MKIKYIGDSTIQTAHGTLTKDIVIEVDETAGKHLLAMRNKNQGKMFIVIKVKKEKPVKEKPAKVRMVIEERDGE